MTPGACLLLTSRTDMVTRTKTFSVDQDAKPEVCNLLPLTANEVICRGNRDGRGQVCVSVQLQNGKGVIGKKMTKVKEKQRNRNQKILNNRERRTSCSGRRGNRCLQQLHKARNTNSRKIGLKVPWHPRTVRLLPQCPWDCWERSAGHMAK